MADFLSILKYPHPNLRIVATDVVNFDDKLANFTNLMVATMNEVGGIGLSATQVDYHQRIIVIDITKKKTNPQIFINPKIIANEGLVKYNEGCLSVPDIFKKVARYKTITLSYQDIYGNFHTLKATKLLAVCIQHEIDHLNGILFVDYLSSIQKAKLVDKFI